MRTRLNFAGRAAAAMGRPGTRRAPLIGSNIYLPAADEKVVQLVSDPRGAEPVRGRPPRVTASCRNLHGGRNGALVTRRVLMNR